MLSAALDPGDPGPKCYLCEGPDITLLGDRPLRHYDMTGQCQGQHPHVAWDPASSDIDEAAYAAYQLGLAALDANSSANNPIMGVGPHMWVIPVALWTAGSSGQGTRAAMDWLSAGQLAQMVAYCEPLAERLGRGSLPWLESAASLLQGPEDQRHAAVRQAWNSLAPVEEAIRNGVNAQPLDLRSWLASSAILAVSLPPGASIAQRQIAVAMLVAANRVTDQDASLLQPTMIWHNTGAPHPHGDPTSGGKRLLVLAGRGAAFASWTASSWGSAWLLGSDADPGALEAASRRLGAAGVPEISAGQVLLIPPPRVGPPVILTSTAR